MKGEMEITVKVKDEFSRFPVTETFVYKRDNTFESFEEWLKVFNMILHNQGFCSSLEEMLEVE